MLIATQFDPVTVLLNRVTVLRKVAAIASICGATCSPALAVDPIQVDAAISKAVNYLAAEVPKWQTDHQCASCHNQADAARALIESHRQGLSDQTPALESTLLWLSRPNEWKNNRGAPEFNDPNLATVQFAGTLLAAQQCWKDRFDQPVRQAAESVAKLQRPDGSWRIDGESLFGSPITHGAILLTRSGMSLLRRADSKFYAQHIEFAQQWLLKQPVRNIIGASSLILALRDIASTESIRFSCAAKLLSEQGSDGGFGPHANAQAEVFDTALGLLALLAVERTLEIDSAIKRSTEFLLAMQEDGGYWNETTRPSGTESYAHRVSTTGWATQALLAVRGRLREREKTTSPAVREK